MNGQAVSPTVLKAYVVQAAARFEGVQGVPTSVSFLVSSESGKQAWVEARARTRTGGEVKDVEGGKLFALAPGVYTVRAVQAVERTAPKAKAPLTLDAFLTAAEAEGLTLPKRFKELVDRLRAPAPAAAPAPAPAPAQSESESEAA